MQQGELRELLSAVTADRVAIIQRHEAGARVVGHYDFNNAYQYVIAREETKANVKGMNITFPGLNKYNHDEKEGFADVIARFQHFSQ